MKTFVISLGGSILFPEQVNISYLKRFKTIIARHSKKNRFILIIGGGQTARKYQAAAKNLGLKNQDLDWIGIYATWLNANFVKTIFKDIASSSLINNPAQKNNFKKIIFAGGWKPGCSTDYDAVLLARTYQVDTLINITNVEYLHDKNPSKYKNTKILKQTNWQTMRKIIGVKRWSPGLNAPFDPIAARLAQKLKLKLILIGPNLKNLDNLLKKKKFKGSIVEN